MARKTNKNRKARPNGMRRQADTLIGSTQANRQYKASVFASLMGVEEAAREVYFALKNFWPPDGARFEVVTLRDALYLGQLNDCAFIIGGVIILILEHQGSLNPNMPIRVLIYLAREYEKVLAGDRGLYGTRLVKIPRPEFYVLYNGKARLKDENGNNTDFRTYRLSDAFMDAPEGDTPFQGRLELEVPVYDINDGHNAGILGRSARLRQYAKFIAKVREFEAQREELQEAIKLAVEYCIKNDILKDYLKENAAEVLSLLFDEITMDDLRDVLFRDGKAEGIDIGKKEGIDIGKKEGKKEGIDIGENRVLDLMEKGYSSDQIRKTLAEEKLAAQVD